MLNPTTPFLVRDGWPGKAPYVVATYDWGKEVRKELPKDEAQIDATVRAGGISWQTNRGEWECVCLYVMDVCADTKSTPLPSHHRSRRWWRRASPCPSTATPRSTGGRSPLWTQEGTLSTEGMGQGPGM